VPVGKPLSDLAPPAFLLPTDPNRPMPRVRATRRLHFNAAHRLYRPDWSDEENTRVFGLCSNPHGHGHNYELEISVEGEINPETGYVMDLGELKARVNAAVVDQLDHRNLNVQVPWLQGINPTTENLVVAIWNRIVPLLPPGVELARLVLWETPRNYVEYSGEGAPAPVPAHDSRNPG
jgi:6-pyruvoyltetrahydropterin/6-carboxytetrahydropterin synthase